MSTSIRTLGRTLRLAVLLSLAAGAHSQEPGSVPAELAERTQALIAALDAEGFEERERATQALEALGPAVRPLLEAAAVVGSPERRLRLRSVLSRLPELASEPEPLEATRASLAFVDASLEDVVAALERDSTLRFFRPIGAAATQRLRLEAADRPVWELLDRVADSAGLRWYRDWGTGTLRFAPRLPGTPALAYAGPLRVALSGVTRTLRLDFGAPSHETCTLTGTVDVEPQSPVIAVALPPAITRALDDQARDLLGETRRAPHVMHPVRERGGATFALGLSLPDGEAVEIALLEGSLDLVVATEQDAIELLVNRPHRAGIGGLGTRARIAADVPSRSARMIRVAITTPALGSGVGGGAPLRDRSLRFEDASGREISMLGPPTSTIVGDEELLDCQLPPESRPMRVVAIVTTKTAERRVPFAFERLPLR